MNVNVTNSSDFYYYLGDGPLEILELPERYMIWWYEHTFNLPCLLLIKAAGWVKRQLHRRMMFANKARYIKCKHNK